MSDIKVERNCRRGILKKWLGVIGENINKNLISVRWSGGKQYK